MNVLTDWIGVDLDMGSGVLLAALVVLWFVVLVPMVVTRGGPRTAETTTAVSSGRTLQRRRVHDPVVHAETERVEIDRAALRSSGELQVDVHALRRRTLAGLVALTVLATAGALSYAPWIWAPQVLLTIATVGYLLVIRAAAQRERRAAVRRQGRRVVRPPDARPASRPAARRPAPVVVPAAPVVVPAAAAPSVPVPNPSLPLAPVHPLRPGRVVAARTPVAAGAPDGAVVGLDDDDIGFADVAEYRPRQVASA